MCLLGFDHRSRGDKAQDEWNKMEKQAYKIAADDAKATIEGDEVDKCTSRCVLVAVANHLKAVVSTKERVLKETKEELHKLG